MVNVGILDCTLRDGGYVNNWEFSDSSVIDTISNLSQAGIEIIECGFLDRINGKPKGSTRFSDIDSLNSILGSIDKIQESNAMHVAMIEAGRYPIEDLPLCKETHIQGIRYSFRRSEWEKSIDACKTIIEKGYKLFVQPISTGSYKKDELIDLIKSFNFIDMYAIYIVDTQGGMFDFDFQELLTIFKEHVKDGVKIGFHSHNNMQLSYSIAINFIESMNGSTERGIIIDSSVYGMGRGAGNLNSELVSDYLNKKCGKTYDIPVILELIDHYYYSLYKSIGWGYSLAHFLSASAGCHPNYAAFLLNKKNLNVVNIGELLSLIPEDSSSEFEQSIIENIYYDFNIKQKAFDSSLPFAENDTFLILASGKSVRDNISIIKNKREEFSYYVAVNHIPESIECDFFFFNSQKRYDHFRNKVDHKRLITTSNVALSLEHSKSFQLDYGKLVEVGDTKNDNSAIIFINYLTQLGCRQAYIAGMDGFSFDEENYSYLEPDSVVDKSAIDDLNRYIYDGLMELKKKIEIYFIGDSIFKKMLKQRVIGVIPARISSTRLPNKPLHKLCGLPMVVHVMKRAQMSSVLDDVIVATDSEEISDAVKMFGGKAVITSPDHQNGTLRMHEVSMKIPGDIFVLINGDEPLVVPSDIDDSVNCLLKSDGAVASLLVSQYSERNDQSNFKVALNNKDEILYISRSDIPSDDRQDKKAMWKAYHVVSYKKGFLDVYANSLKQTELDAREMNDQLRILEYGYKIQAAKVTSQALSVDTIDDAQKVEQILLSDELFLKYKS